jgi:hypothetical protein
MSNINTTAKKNEEEKQQQLREMRGARLFQNGNVCMTDGAFYVQSEANSETVYEVQGNICECHDFMRRGLPCKHIKAVEFYFLANGGVGGDSQQ